MDNQKVCYVVCPHCNLLVQIFKDDVKCAIFRHGIYKKTNKQMNPHAKKEVCNKVAKKGLIIGCGKPFRLIVNQEDFTKSTAEICDYI